MSAKRVLLGGSIPKWQILTIVHFRTASGCKYQTSRWNVANGTVSEKKPCAGYARAEIGKDYSGVFTNGLEKSSGFRGDVQEQRPSKKSRGIAQHAQAGNRKA